MISKLICFVVCHGGPADHFCTFSETFEKAGYEVQFYASGPALQKLKERNIQTVTAFNAEDSSLVHEIAEKCLASTVTITDLAHPFDESLLNALKERNVKAIGYYDNGEPFVPGGYSETVAKAAQYASKVLFANANLAEETLYKEIGHPVNLPLDKRIGLGYYPLDQANKIAALRVQKHISMRLELLADHNLNKDSKVLVYFGGNNTEYFEKAFPAFLKVLSEGIELQDLSNTVIVLQQHPGAKNLNFDGQKLQEWIQTQGVSENAPKVIISEKSSEEMQVIAGGALYYQTSMGPLFAWAGIPRTQVGHEVYNDILVRGNLCYVATTAESLLHAISNMKEEPVSLDQKNTILNSLGIQKDWAQILLNSIL